MCDLYTGNMPVERVWTMSLTLLSTTMLLRSNAKPASAAYDPYSQKPQPAAPAPPPVKEEPKPEPVPTQVRVLNVVTLRIPIPTCSAGT